MKSPRIFALATSIIAISLSVMPTNADALTRASGVDLSYTWQQPQALAR
jgi:hypothetical protein